MKTQYLKIQSQGEIELGAFTLIGASTKRNDSSKIGYYGSGLKYSISSLIRNKIGFRIYSGTSEVFITTETQNFRKDSFEMILVNGATTSLTTNMGGEDWDRPFAPIREIYSNALDEDADSSLSSSELVGGDQGFTTFYIEMTADVSHFFKNVKSYFCNQNEDVLFVGKSATIYKANDNRDIRLFRRNILCYHDSKEPALFNYNSGDFTINESRVLSSIWGARRYCANAWMECKNKTMITELIMGLKGGNTGYWEHDLDWDLFFDDEFSDEWHDVCHKLKFVPSEIVTFASSSDLIDRIILPAALLKALYRKFDDLDILGLSEGINEVKFIPKLEVSTVLTNKIADAMALLNKTTYSHRLENIDIRYVSFIDKYTLGYADSGIIYLSVKLDNHDVNSIAKIIIEENEHNRTGYGDETRSFQDHLFSLFFEELTR